ncbi:pentatricopeptide repeat-containing protein At2g13600 [Fagus crenata]
MVAARRVFGGMERHDEVSWTLIISSIDEAHCIFDETVEKNNVLWTSMIMGYAQSDRALELFEHLVTAELFTPDHICFTAMLTACNHAGFLERGIEYF